MTTIHIGVAYDQVPDMVYTEDGPFETVRELLFIVAEASDGRRWSFASSHGVDVFEPSEEVDAIITANTAVSPLVQPDAWREIDPVYGSEAWDDEAEYGLACFEADCFNEPRPEWR